MTVCVIVRDCCNCIWNCLTPTEVLEKTQMIELIANEFYKKNAIPQLHRLFAWETYMNNIVKWKWLCS
jgi:hypothetical protein